MSPAAGLEVSSLTVRFGDAVAVDEVSLAVEPGETVAVVGPSGSGKSSLLRAVAGLERPATGTVTWDGTDLTAVAPHERGFGLMFQDHALFGHRTVGENVAFGVRMQGADRAAQAARVAEVLEQVDLAGFADRTIDTLSGGEAQRVALARALAPSPRLLMLDEPLGSLDRSLRDRLAHQIRAVLGELGLAAVHVTHDQEEAYAVADRLVVMRAGRVVRDGAAAEVWGDPGTEFVARFLGHENIVDAADAIAMGLGDGTGPVVVREAALAIAGHTPTATPPTSSAAAGGRGAGTPLGLPATVGDVRFRGPLSRVELDVALPTGPTVRLVVHTARPPAAGDEVVVTVDPTQTVPLHT